MNRITPFIWISLGLASLTLVLVLFGSWAVDMIPSEDTHLL